MDALAAYYTTVLHGLSIQARDGASRKTLASVVECAMSVWDQMAALLLLLISLPEYVPGYDW